MTSIRRNVEVPMTAESVLVIARMSQIAGADIADYILDSCLLHLIHQAHSSGNDGIAAEASDALTAEYKRRLAELWSYDDIQTAR